MSKISNEAFVACMMVIGCIIAFTLWTKSENSEGSSKTDLGKLDISTKHKKKIGESEWKHFDYAVSECRIVIQNNDYLKKRSEFWEGSGIDPAVGYAAWLFQETRFNGNAVGDNGRAHGYGQIHPPALWEMNNIREKRGCRTFSHNELRGRSRERLEFFLEALHDYGDLCEKRHKRKRGLDADLNAWNGGGKRTTKETKYSGEIKAIILQYYEREKAKEAQKKKAGTQACWPFTFLFN